MFATSFRSLSVPALCLTLALTAPAQRPAPSASVAAQHMVDTVEKNWPSGAIGTTGNPANWSYEEGVLLDGITAHWQLTQSPADLAYIQSALDKYIQPDGSIHINPAGKPFQVDAHSLDNIELGRAILFLYAQTHQERYRKAAEYLHLQLAAQPRTASGGFWHKQIYPQQMWLDGAYMAEPFRARYAASFGPASDFQDIARQLLLMDQHMRDPRTGLLLHGWDESRQMPWADKQTGLSPQVWARAMGWYAMALVDVLDWFPKNDPQRPQLIAALRTTMQAVVKTQDQTTGLWWQVVDQPGKPGNYLEASASAMFVYALQKGVRMGYLPPDDTRNARKGWQGIESRFIKTNPDGTVTLTGTVKVGGLGGKPYRSGTYDYYIGEKTVDDDAKGIGAYLLAASEIAKAK